MEENKFERQIQQKMDELKIQPSDAVWPKIEARLDKKRPSRRAFWLLLFACVFFATAYLLWNSTRYSNKSDNKSELTASKKESNQSQKNIDNLNGNSQPKINPVTGGTNIPAYPVDKGTVNKNNDKNTVLRVKKPGDKKTAIDEKIVPASGEVAKNSNEKIKSQIINGSAAEDKPANEKIQEQVADQSSNKVDEDILQKKDSSKNLSKAPDTSKHSVASSSNVIHRKKSKWQFGMLLSGGVSAVGNDFLGLTNPIPLDYLNAVGQVTRPPGNIAAALPSKTRSGFGFLAGLVVERNISLHLNLTSGLNFKSFNTSNKIGSRDTFGYYSSRTAVNNHNNHFDFIEVPVGLKIQFGKGKKIPLSWQGGFVVSELISSNALQFNSASGSYYKDNSTFNKTQFGLNTSLSAGIFLNGKTSLSIGPYFYYSVSRLANDGLYNEKHFIFTGLSTVIIFGK